MSPEVMTSVNKDTYGLKRLAINCNTIDYRKGEESSFVASEHLISQIWRQKNCHFNSSLKLGFIGQKETYNIKKLSPFEW